MHQTQMEALSQDQWTLVDALRAQSGHRGNSVYCRFHDGRSCTFKQLDEASGKFASGLAGLGIGPGDRVMIIAGNRLEYLVAFYGVQKRRAIFVPVNVEIKGGFLRHQIANSRPRAIIVDKGALEDLDAADIAGIDHIISLDPPSANKTALHSILFLDLIQGSNGDAVERPRPNDVCLILYTSGTSGPSKGVLVPQCHAFLFGLQQARAMSVTEADVYYVCLPMFHVNALLMSLVSCLVTGASAHVAARFSTSAWLKDIQACRATLTNMLGAMAEFIIKQPPSANDRQHSLKRIMAVPVSASWGADFLKRYGVRLIQVYGMTECNIVSFTGENDELVPGCVGPVTTDYFDVTIIDSETGNPVTPGDVGEICIRPRILSGFMAGYYAMPEITVKAWQGLWFHTGDAGRFDSNQSLYFVDRLGDCIRRRGENISSFEIERVLLTHTNVLECAVIGTKVEGAGGEDEIKACLVTDGAPIDFIEFTRWCADRLPRYAVPRFIESYELLPKTATGKVQKQKLREAGVTAATWDREKAGLTLARAVN